MKTEQVKQLRRRMGEAAALPPSDPIRHAVEREVGQAGSWARQEWYRLLKMDDNLRWALRDISPPEGLTTGLLSIPSQTPPQHRRFVRPAFAVAAVILLIVAVTGVLNHHQPVSIQNERIERIAMAAISDHETDQHVTVRTSDPTILLASLSKEVPFKADLPPMTPQLALIGGRKCAIAEQTVLYSLWEMDNHRYSLFQFDPRNYGLPSAIQAQKIVPQMENREARCIAYIWSVNDCAFVLVADCDAPVPDIVDDVVRFEEATTASTYSLSETAVSLL